MIITIWGAEGMECDCFASLPWVQYIADIIYTGNTLTEETQCNLKANCGFDFTDFRYAGSMDVLEFFEDKHYPNISRTLLWENPLLGTMQPQLEGEVLNSHYREVAKNLDQMRKKKGNERLELPWRLADILSEKADLPTIIRNAYLEKDYNKLNDLCQQTIPTISKKINELKNYHRALWIKNYKPFGWEALEARYSSLLGLFEHLLFRLQSFINGECDSLPELDEKRLKIFNEPKAKFPHQLYTQIRDIPSASS
jgi:Glycoside Hydrolase 20C C-terminal domain